MSDDYDYDTGDYCRTCYSSGGGCVSCATEPLEARIDELTAELEKERARLNWLWRSLPFSERHKSGGDEAEMRQGIDAAIAKGISHHSSWPNAVPTPPVSPSTPE